MNFFYFVWWLIWNAERLPNSFDAKPFDNKDDPDFN